MDMNLRLAERVAPLAQIAPISGNNTTKNTGWFRVHDIAKRILVLIMVGVIDTTIDAVLEAATLSDGTGAKTIKSITQITSVQDGSIVTIDCRDEELTEGFPYARVTLTIGNATASLVSCIVLGGDFTYGLAQEHNDAAVLTQVT